MDALPGIVDGARKRSQAGSGPMFSSLPMLEATTSRDQCMSAVTSIVHHGVKGSSAVGTAQQILELKTPIRPVRRDRVHVEWKLWFWPQLSQTILALVSRRASYYASKITSIQSINPLVRSTNEKVPQRVGYLLYTYLLWLGLLQPFKT